MLVYKGQSLHGIQLTQKCSRHGTISHPGPDILFIKKKSPHFILNVPFIGPPKTNYLGPKLGCIFLAFDVLQSCSHCSACSQKLLKNTTKCVLS